MTSVNDAALRDWCRRDFATTRLQRGSLPLPEQLPKPQRAAGDQRQRSQSTVSASSGTTTHSRMNATQTRLRTDHISEYVPPGDTRQIKRDPQKFDALSRSDGWYPHTANVAGAQRAVYDPLAHKTTVYTFGMAPERNRVGKSDPMQPPTLPTVHRREGKGDELLRAKFEADLQRGTSWHGRRKGVVEFVDRTHAFAVNSNDAFVRSCNSDPRAFHPKVGEMTNWMDNAFHGKMKVPFYGKHPYEMHK